MSYGGHDVSETVSLFLCGDVMTGRGIDQILPRAGDPALNEPYVKDARDYVELALEKGARLSFPVSYSYVWGDALQEFDRVNPDFKIINLETTITRSEEWVRKGINYRMHPQNLPCLSAAQIDCCVLANNHMLDFGYSGLLETLESLAQAKIAYVGAGKNHEQAQNPACLTSNHGPRVLVFSYGVESSGVPSTWAATASRPGVAFLEDLSKRSVEHVAEEVRSVKREGDLVVFSIHWGGNWGYEISETEIQFARALIDHASVDVVHGHSSHHPKAIELYRGKPILYGCGDFINDYEGIHGYEEYRGDLGVMYFLKMDRATGSLLSLEMVPTQMRALQVVYASAQDTKWLKELLNKESRRFGVYVGRSADNRLQAA